MKRNLNKALSILLSLTMVTALVVAPRNRALAADTEGVSFRADVDSYIDTSLNTASTTGTATGNTAHVLWNMGNNIGSGTKFEMTYHIRDGYDMKLNVDKDSDGKGFVKVDYSVVKSDDPTAYVNVTEGLRIFDQTRNEWRLPADIAWLPSDPSSDGSEITRVYDGTNPEKAVFKIKQGMGFYFRAFTGDGKNYDIAIKYDAVTGVFHFSTNGVVADGTIYDFTLVNATVTSAPIAYETVYVMPGYTAGNGIVSKPIARDDNTPDDYYKLDSVNDPNSPLPGTETGVNITINYPKIWDETAFAFKPTGDDGAGTNSKPFIATLSLPSTVASEPDGVVSIDFKSKTVTMAGSLSSNVNVDVDTSNPKALIFDIKGLESGMVYNNSTVNIEPPMKVYSKRSDLGNAIYTFLRYEVVSDGSQDFFLDIDTYRYANGRRIDGVYTVFATPTTTEDSTQNIEWGNSNRLESRTYKANSGETKILVSLGTQVKIGGAANWFMVRFTSSSNAKDEWDSQNYKKKVSYEDVQLPTPEILIPLDPSVVVSLVKGENDELVVKDRLFLLIEWRIGMKDMLEALGGDKYRTDPDKQVKKLYYVFKKGVKPNDNIDTGSEYNPFMVATVDLEELMNYDPTADNATDNIVYLTPEGEIEDESPLEGKNFNEDTTIVVSEQPSYYEKSITIDGKVITYSYGRMEVSIPIYKQGVTPPSSVIDPPFLYPNTYFLNMYAYYNDPTRAPEANRQTANSLPKNISISAVEQEEIPAPGSFEPEIESTTKTGLTLKWNAPDISRYEKYMLNPMRMATNFNYDYDQTSLYKEVSQKYNLYISKSKSNMQALTSALATSLDKESLYNVMLLPDADKDQAPEQTKNAKSVASILATQLRIEETDVESDPKMDYNFSDNSNNGTGSFVTPFDGKPEELAVDWIRNGNIVMLQGITSANYLQTFKLLGLDENDVYYVAVDASITPYEWEYDDVTDMPEIDNNGVPKVTDEIFYEKTQYSKFSPIISVTTKNTVTEPKPEEVSPQSPTNVDKRDVTQNKATIFWDRLQRLTDAERGMYQYQLLRVRNTRLTDVQVTSLMDVPDLMKLLPATSEAVSWQTLSSDDVAVYDPSSELFEPYDISITPQEYDFFTTTEYNNFTDITLSANQLYFYYVRTVMVTPPSPGDTGVPSPVSYSIWMPVSVTTDPVTPPKNLYIEQSKIVDKLTQTVVSFDAPVTTAQLQNGDAYFGVLVTKDGVEQPELELKSQADINSLISSSSAAVDEGYTHYEYTIKNLKPNTGYSIKIRIYDDKLEEWSPYSKTITTRTDFDQEDYDREHETDKWTKYYKDKLAELLKNPYWKLAETAAATTGVKQISAVYRTSMYDGQIMNSADGVVLLGASSSAARTKQEYFIPASTIIKNNNAGKGFIVKFDNGVSVTVPANALSADNVAAMRQALTDKKLADYYVRVTVTTTSKTTKVEGNDAASPQIELAMEVVGTTKTEKSWDTETYSKWLAKISDETMLENFDKELQDMFEDKVSNEALVLFVEKKVAELEKVLMAETATSFAAIKSTSYTLAAVAKPIVIKSDVTDAADVAGYKYNSGLWINQNVIPYGLQKGISTTTPGTYIFAGNTINLPNVSNLENGGTITSLYSKYGLGEYLGKDLTTTALASAATTGQIAGSIARLAGAPKTADPISWLSGKGYKISSRNEYANIQNQEAIYLLMALYEMRTNTKTDSIKITNYSLTSGITGIDERYKKSIQAAYQLGFTTDTKLQPRSTMTVKEFLVMLGKLAKKVKM